MKKRKQLIIFIAAIIVIVGLAIGLQVVNGILTDPYRDTATEYEESLDLDETLSESQAWQDIDYVMDMLCSCHPAWLEDDNELAQKVEAAYAAAVSQNAGEMTVLEEWIVISGILNELHDGHTAIYVNDSEARYIEDYTRIAAGQLPTKIDGMPINDLFSEYLKVSSYECETYARANFYHNGIVSENVLRLCGVDTSDGAVFTFDQNGDKETYRYDFVPLNEVHGYNGADDAEWISYEIDGKGDVAILTLRSCEYNQEYIDTLKAFFDEVRTEKIKNIAVDLRYNGGGNSMVVNEFLKYIDVDEYRSFPCEIRRGNTLRHHDGEKVINKKVDHPFDGCLYVLTNTQTYSSAMDFAMFVKDNRIGWIIGEASGNMPNGYGDCLNFYTPNSKLPFCVSYKHWHRIDSNHENEPVVPDYGCSSDEAIDKLYYLCAAIE